MDVSGDALALAAENATRLGLSERVRFAKADLRQGMNGEFHLIVANLPYVSTQDRQLLSREVLHDPEVALFGGEAGDELIRKLIAQSTSHFRPGGLLALEIGIGQSEALIAFLREKNYHDIESKRDYSGIPRFIFARYG